MIVGATRRAAIGAEDLVRLFVVPRKGCMMNGWMGGSGWMGGGMWAWTVIAVLVVVLLVVVINRVSTK